jgi:copper(I)-binding protein
MKRRHVLHAARGIGAVLLVPRARACETIADHLRVVHPWTRATPPGATEAVLCMTIDEVTAPDRLIGVETPVAEAAAMGGVGAGPTVDFPVEPGGLFVLDEGGTFVRLTGLRHPLAVGRKYPLKLTFERSGVVLAELSVDF